MLTARNRRLFTAYAVASLLATAAAQAQVVRAAARDLATVTAARDAFRTDLGGGTVAGSNGSFGGLRREINCVDLGSDLRGEVLRPRH